MADYRDLADLISTQLVGQPHDIESTLPERFRVDQLVDMARCVGLGDVSLQEFLAACSRAGVDVSIWVEENFS